jgi:hypothetical protein
MAGPFIGRIVVVAGNTPFTAGGQLLHKHRSQRSVSAPILIVMSRQEDRLHGNLHGVLHLVPGTRYDQNRVPDAHGT